MMIFHSTEFHEERKLWSAVSVALFRYQGQGGQTVSIVISINLFWSIFSVSSQFCFPRGNILVSIIHEFDSQNEKIYSATEVKTEISKDMLIDKL